MATPGRSYVTEGKDGVGDENRAAGLGGEIGGEIEPVVGGWGVVESGELGEDEDRAGGRDKDGSMAGPGGAERRKEAEAAGERVADDEGFIVVVGVGPEVEEAGRGGDGGGGSEGEEVKGESEPLVAIGVEGMER